MGLERDDAANLTSEKMACEKSCRRQDKPPRPRFKPPIEESPRLHQQEEAEGTLKSL